MNLFVSVILAVIAIVELIFRKKFGIKAERPYRYRSNAHKWIERILLILLPIIFISFYVFPYSEYFALLFIGIIIVLSGARTLNGFRYESGRKEGWPGMIWTSGMVLIFVGISYYIFQAFTFAEALEEFESFPSEIHQVEVQHREQDFYIIYVKRHAIIEDEQRIDSLMASLAQLELRRGFDNRGDFDNYYRLYFNDEMSNSVTIYDKFVMIEGELYKVVGENWLFTMIDEANLGWALPQ